jgi:adenylate cyclase
MKKFFLKEFPFIFLFMLLSGFFYIRGCEFVDFMELKSLDYRVKIKGREKPVDDVVIVAIDEKSIKEIGRWPWSRDVIARGIEKLINMGAKVIGLDIVFSEREEFRQKEKVIEFLNQLEDEELKKNLINVIQNINPDKKLIETFKKFNDKVVAGYFVFMSEEELGSIKMKWTDRYIKNSAVNVIINSTPQTPILLRKAIAVENNIQEIEASATHFGFFNAVSDKDGIYRKGLLLLQIGDLIYPSLPLEMLRVYTGSNIVVYATDGFITKIKIGKYSIFPDEKGTLPLSFLGPGRTFPHYSFTDIINGRIPDEKINGKMVLIGATAIGIYDLRPTPLDERFPGVEIHATVIDNILQSRPLRRYDWMWVFELLGIWLMFFIMGMVFLKTGPLPSIFTSLGIIFFFNALAFYLFLKYRVWVILLYPNISLLGLTLLLSFYKYFSEERMKKMVRNAFSKYLSDKLVDIIVKNPEKLKLGGEKREISVLFSDIRGFTSISEKLSPEEIANLLHEYLTPMSEVILQHDGLLDKYIGDAIMALFGTPVWMETHAIKACEAALSMMKKLDELNKYWERTKGLRLKIGIGINTGECIVGNMGSDILFDYTAIGDTVNLASRLEGTTKFYGVGIVVSEFTVSKTDGRFLFRELDLVRVKGKEKPVKIYELMGKEATEEMRKFISQFHSALGFYREGKWDSAIEEFKKCLEIYSDDKPSKIYIERCLKLNEMKIEKWEGIYEMEVK